MLGSRLPYRRINSFRFIPLSAHSSHGCVNVWNMCIVQYVIHNHIRAMSSKIHLLHLSLFLYTPIIIFMYVCTHGTRYVKTSAMCEDSSVTNHLACWPVHVNLTVVFLYCWWNFHQKSESFSFYFICLFSSFKFYLLTKR